MFPLKKKLLKSKMFATKVSLLGKKKEIDIPDKLNTDFETVLFKEKATGIAND